MSEALEYTISFALPVAITLALLLFVWMRRRNRLLLEDYYASYEKRSSEASEPGFAEYLKHLIARGNVSLRVLEEVFLAGSGHYSFTLAEEPYRIHALFGIQNALRRVLKDSIQQENFEEVRDTIIKLIDEAQEEIEALQEREPFAGLQEPEKSLLIDLLDEIPAESKIPRQKAFQLADIIKLKHQDIRDLQVENSKSATWTRWGTFGTIFFGLLSLILSIFASRP